MVADGDCRECEAAEEGDPDRGDEHVARRQTGAFPREVRAERRCGQPQGEDDRDDPARVLRQHVVRHVVDLLVLDADHALGSEYVQDHALPDEQSGERDDERRHAHERDERSLGAADRGSAEDCDRDRDQTREVVPRARNLQLGDEDSREAADVADGKVDLADQQDEDDADGDHGHAGHLPDQVREVDRAEEDAGLRAEVGGDRDDPDDHRQAADVPRLERVPAVADDRAERLLLYRGNTNLCRGRFAHAAFVSASAPNVIAWTISCCVVASLT